MQLRMLICVSKYTTNISKHVLIIDIPTKIRGRKQKCPKIAEDEITLLLIQERFLLHFKLLLFLKISNLNNCISIFVSLKTSFLRCDLLNDIRENGQNSDVVCLAPNELCLDLNQFIFQASNEMISVSQRRLTRLQMR